MSENAFMDFQTLFILGVRGARVGGHYEDSSLRRWQNHKGTNCFFDKRTGEKSIIIFVTGYREYMEDAFGVNAFHYLV